MTNADKARRIAAMFEEGRESDAYMALEHMLKEREWPDWLKQVCAEIDRPINLEDSTHGTH